MRTIRFILRKEFLQIFRNKGMLPIIFVMPFIQLLILSNAATFDVKNVKFQIVDRDRSDLSRQLIERFTSTHHFILTDMPTNYAQAEGSVLKNEASLIVEIPAFFEKDVITGATAKLQLVINSEDGSTAGVIQSYAAQIIQDFTRQAVLFQPTQGTTQRIEIIARNWYNPELNYKHYMIPGILVALVTMIGLFLSGMNVVREKEIGTIEQINVTPIKKHQFIIGKLLPFLIIGLFELAMGLVIGRLVFDLPMLGGLPLVFGITIIYLILVLGLGLFISTVTETQQQAMFIAWFFMVIFMLMGGLFTPLDSMPLWAQQTMWINPVALFIRILRQVLLKGAPLYDIIPYVSALIGLAFTMFTLAVIRYRKTSE